MSELYRVTTYIPLTQLTGRFQMNVISSSKVDAVSQTTATNAATAPRKVSIDRGPFVGSDLREKAFRTKTSGAKTIGIGIFAGQNLFSQEFATKRRGGGTGKGERASISTVIVYHGSVNSGTRGTSLKRPSIITGTAMLQANRTSLSNPCLPNGEPSYFRIKYAGQHGAAPWASKRIILKGSLNTQVNGLGTTTV